MLIRAAWFFLPCLLPWPPLIIRAASQKKWRMFMFSSTKRKNSSKNGRWKMEVLNPQRSRSTRDTRQALALKFKLIWFDDLVDFWKQVQNPPAPRARAPDLKIKFFLYFVYIWRRNCFYFLRVFLNFWHWNWLWREMRFQLPKRQTAHKRSLFMDVSGWCKRRLRIKIRRWRSSRCRPQMLRSLKHGRNYCHLKGGS